MKIKMRTDDVGVPGGNEWAAMNDWLAELKDESQADEGRGSQASLTGVDDREPVSGPGPAHDARAAHDRQRASSERPASDPRPVSDPRAASSAWPVRDPRPRGGTRPGRDPRPGGDPQPVSDARTVGDPRPARDPRTISDPRAVRDPRTTSDPRAVRDPRTTSDRRTTRDPRPARDPRTISDPRAASNPRPVRDPQAARHERPTGGVNGRSPAAPPMRAVIGDELRMPIMWCEMGSCISWHADPSALGEADNRDRAILAGWRIDALGRLACPQCQQTTVAFRATRPVVLWDRATAMVMAARAAAPGYRVMGTAGRASDRRPRPAVHQ